MEEKKANKRRLPSWMRMQMPEGQNYSVVKNLVNKHGLHTICTSGNCPNIGECWNRGTATFMILGEICTRSCKFCGVRSGRPGPVDASEAGRVAESIRVMGLTHCVITSVDRDDLEDGGASFWQQTILEVAERIRKLPAVHAETPSWERVQEKCPDIILRIIDVIEEEKKRWGPKGGSR